MKKDNQIVDKALTLEKAIEHCYEVVETCKNEKCALDHLQLARWLEEFKKLKEDDIRFNI